MKFQLISTSILLASLSSHCATACLEHLKSANPSGRSMTRKREAAPRTKTAITNVRVFDDEQMSQPQTIIIDGERISPPGAGTDDVQTVIDGTGRFLIPGLIDSHVHIDDVAGLESMTSFGVTTAMVMACRNYTACTPLQGLDGLCAFYSAGVPATGPGSQHAKAFNLTSDQLLYPSDNASTVVSYTFGNGSSFYKITAETNGPSQETQTNLVQATHDLGKQSMTHASTLQSWEQAVTSGTDGVQHIATDGPLNSSLLSRMAASGQFSTPTMNIARYAFSDPTILAFLHKSPEGNSYATVKSNVMAIHNAGIPILAGTDAVGSITSSISVPFGLTLHYELQDLVEAGLTPAEALRAATSTAARYHRVQDRGVIAPGLRADLILLNSDPLVNISNTLDIEKVWVGGVDYEDVVNGKLEAAKSPNPSLTAANATSGTTPGSNTATATSHSTVTPKSEGRCLTGYSLRLMWSTLPGLLLLVAFFHVY